jgi:uncharacterized RDD family membrane protein YckC
MAVYKFAGFWRRLVAYTIDNIIINIIFFTMFIIAMVAFVFSSISSEGGSWLTDIMEPARMSFALLLTVASYLFLFIAYFTYFHGMNGRTPGKMLLGLQVISTEGTRISFGIAFLRAVGYFVSAAVFHIGFIWAAFDRRKQGWHDKIAGTVVIIRPQENEAAGINIPDTSPHTSFTPSAENQNTVPGQTAFSTDNPITGDNTVKYEQSGVSDEKIS